jgi:AcrR family transcriptional regulator
MAKRQAVASSRGRADIPLRRDEILATAAALFGSSGYVGTSLKDVADACGILPGSLYHHFESKEAIAIELLERYDSELGSLADTSLTAASSLSIESFYSDFIRLATSIAHTAVRHRAALHLTVYEPPAGASERLLQLTRRTPVAVEAALQEILNRGKVAGLVKPDIDTALLAKQVSLSVRHAGLPMVFPNASPEQVAATVCEIVLGGVAADPPDDEQLNRSAAMQAAKTTVQEWRIAEDGEYGGKQGLLRSVARTLFARHGYEATTIRDVASAAAMGTGSVYRFIESKEALLASILQFFQARVDEAYRVVIDSESTTVEKLDALTWLSINIMERFSEEFQIQLAWLREIPPEAANVSRYHEKSAKRLAKLAGEGVRSGELRINRIGGSPLPSLNLIGISIRDLIFPVPEFLAFSSDHLGADEHTRMRGTFVHARDTVLRGALRREKLDPRRR